MQDDDSFVNPRAHDQGSLEHLINQRMSRRRMLERSPLAGAALTVPAMAGCDSSIATNETIEPTDPAASRYQFQEISRGSDETHHIPTDYELDVLLRWGDPLFPDAPAFNAHAQNAAAQSRQFGYNCDFVGFLPLQNDVGQPPRGLLCVAMSTRHRRSCFRMWRGITQRP